MVYFLFGEDILHSHHTAATFFNHLPQLVVSVDRERLCAESCGTGEAIGRGVFDNGTIRQLGFGEGKAAVSTWFEWRLAAFSRIGLV